MTSEHVEWPNYLSLNELKTIPFSRLLHYTTAFIRKSMA